MAVAVVEAADMVEADFVEAVEVAAVVVVSLLLPFPPVPSLMELTRTLVNRRFHLFQLCSSGREQTLVEILIHYRVNRSTLLTRDESQIDHVQHSNTVVLR
jgi:hypothetical protein